MGEDMEGVSKRRALFGLLLALGGVVWILQGLDVFGQDGGMHGRFEWVIIGIIAALGGAALLWSAFRTRDIRR
ncbi:MAG: hypothetical protein M3R06_08920 [Chloroflexota bacterium]|nr:hypothetical protein [Chloroflexota bacterium]